MQLKKNQSTMALIAVALAFCSGCGGGGRGGQSGACDPNEPDCPNGMVCNLVTDGQAFCAMPVTLRGTVVNIGTEEPIADARVQAVDVNGAAVGSSGVTDEAGGYTIIVPAIRDAEGMPVDGSYTLRAQAQSFQEFPTAIRPALPIDVTAAELLDSGWIIENTLTTIALIVLPGDTSDLGSISGAISSNVNAGVLVIAEAEGAALIGFSDSDGGYTIFNVPAGSYTVQGYAAGLQLDPIATSVQDGEAVEGVDLTEADRPLNSVSGSVQIVNAPGDSQTSIVLALESTFVEGAGRGAVPPGLRVGNITGAFTMENVPDGRYVVLAAFENDDLVRDPDQTIGGTQTVSIELPGPTGTTFTLSEGFKVTGALAVTTPGADGPEEVTTTVPTFEWEDDSSEDGYEIRVFDAFGTEVWSDEIGPVSGSPTVTHVYGGPDLASGMFYQFRATSFRDKNGVRTAISRTEDLKGVFFRLDAESAPES